MTTMIINDNYYTLNQCVGDLCEWCDQASIGEYTHYYDKIVYKADGNIYACYADDTSNYWRI